MRRLAPLLVAALACGAFLPALSNGFVNWDDEPTLVTNLHFRGFGWPQLRWMFTTFHTGHYQPLSWISFALDYSVWGLQPFGFHLTSLLLHGINAALVYLLGLRLLPMILPDLGSGRRLPLIAVSGFAALLFGVHPLRVESVAWATQRRDVLSAALLLSTLLLYLRAVRQPIASAAYRRGMGGALAVFLASLFAKAAGITFPIALLVLDAYPLGRLRGLPHRWLGRGQRRILVEKVPFLLCGGIFGVVALLAQQDVSALKAIERYGVPARIAQGLYGIGFYLGKTVVPTDLSPLYEIPIQLDPLAPPFAASGLAVAFVSVSLFLLRSRWPGGLAAWVAYVALLLPVLGIAQSGPQLVADRYSYLSCLPWAWMAGAALFRVWRRPGVGPGRGPALVAGGLGLLVLLGLGSSTWAQARIWHDSLRLWQHAVAVSPGSATAHFNLGAASARRGAIDAAERQYRRSLEINPAAADAHGNLGQVLVRQGRVDEGIRHFREALRIDPRYRKAYMNLGNLAFGREDLAAALEFYRLALELDPADADVHYNLGVLRAAGGDREGAARHYREAARLDPRDARAGARLADLAWRDGDAEGAIAQLREALGRAPQAGELHLQLGTLLALTDRMDEAAEHFEVVLRQRPGFAAGHYNLAGARAAQGDWAGAARHFREALRLQPDFPPAHEGLAAVLDAQDRREEAAGHRETARRLRGAAGKP